MGNKRAEKLVTLKKLSLIAQNFKNQGKKIVLCHGVFDLLHPGHIRHFKSARSYGDILIVTITADRFIKKGPGRPFFNQNLRAETLASLEQVDFVSIVNSDSAVLPIGKIKPHIFVKGPDYRKRKNHAKLKRKLEEEKEMIEKIGGRLIFTDDKIVFSSSSLINNFLETYPPKTKKYLDGLKQKYSADAVIEKLTALSNVKILVIGDAIIDQYHYCAPMGRSSKEPIMVHRFLSHDSFAGGALATANHLASLSQNISLLTLLGKKKSFKSFIIKRLKPEVKPHFYFLPHADTIIKRRYLDAHTKQKQFQLTYITDDVIPQSLEKEILKSLKAEIKKYDLVIVNDFGHGFLTERIINAIVGGANYLSLNVQANSANYGFNVVTKYPRADFVCIDEAEIRLATHDKYKDLKVLIAKVHRKMKCREMIVTRGSLGSIGYAGGNNFWETPSLTEKVVDRVGAGDALFAISSPCLYAGMEKELASFIGNVAGALQVQTVGNKKPIEFSEMVKFITRLLK